MSRIDRSVSSSVVPSTPEKVDMVAERHDLPRRMYWHYYGAWMFKDLGHTGFPGMLFVCFYADGSYTLGNANLSFVFSADGRWIDTLGRWG